MTDHLGGRKSSAVEQQINRLADLLVALADEAVDHQATVGADNFTPATLAAAVERSPSLSLVVPARGRGNTAEVADISYLQIFPDAFGEHRRICAAQGVG